MQFKILYLVVYVLFFLPGCTKFLDEKPDKKLAVFTSTDELQSLLDLYYFVNYRDPGWGEVSADDYYITENDYSAVYDEFQNRAYTWEREFIFPALANDWYNVYRCVYRANTVLDNMASVDSLGNPAVWRDIKGQAYFLRGRSFLAGSFIWCNAYDSLSGEFDAGLPLRLNTDFTLASSRSSLAATYAQVVEDLKQAASLLPVSTIHKIRPNRAAAYGMLARAFLSMRNYHKAFLYADSCLHDYNKLIDYNDPTVAFADEYNSFEPFNEEVITASGIEPPLLVSSYVGKVDSLLYESYDNDDMRKKIFFWDNGDGTYAFKGSYGGWETLFSSIATDEIYLIRAECFARMNEPEKAMKDLNTLLVTRWKTGLFQEYSAGTAAEALQIILRERRKELLMRGLRWMDIKRLNKEGANITLNRLVNGQLFSLPANDLRFALPIPEDIINLTGMNQNPR